MQVSHALCQREIQIDPIYFVMHVSPPIIVHDSSVHIRDNSELIANLIYIILITRKLYTI